MPFTILTRFQPKNTPRTALARYGVGLLAVLSAVLVRYAISPLVGHKYPYFISVFGVVAAAVYGGRGPGLLATAVSALVAAYVLVEPGLGPKPLQENLGAAALIVPFAALGVAITLIVDRLHQANDKLSRTTQNLREANASLLISQEELRRTNAHLQASEQELAKANKRLEQSNNELQAFAYSISHDLQAPLRTIGGFCGLLERRFRNKLDDADELLDYIQGGVNRMSMLVAGLLEYSKVSPENTSAPPCAQCNEVLAGVLRDCGAAISEAGALITYDSLPTIRADPQRISQIFQNLIGNALKYRSVRPPEIHVSAKMEEGCWIFSVKDNGIGFDMANEEKIFGVFQRLHDDSEYQGAGIGLAIVKRVAEQYGGTVWADSTVGDGSTFYFALPVIEPPEALTATSCAP